MFYQLNQRTAKSRQMNRSLPQKPKIQLPLATVKQSQMQLKLNTNSSVQDMQQGVLHLSKQSTILDHSHFELQNLVYELKSTINDLCVKNQHFRFKEEQLSSDIRFLLKEKSAMVQQIHFLKNQLQRQKEQMSTANFSKTRELSKRTKAYVYQKSSNFPILSTIQRVNKNQIIQNKRQLQQCEDCVKSLTKKVNQLQEQNKNLRNEVENALEQKMIITKNFHNSKNSEIAQILIKSDQQKAVLRLEGDSLKVCQSQLKTQIEYLKQRGKQMEQRIQYYKNQLKIKMSFLDLVNSKQEESLSLGIRKRQEKIDELMIQNNRLMNAVNSLQHKLSLKDHYLQIQKQLNAELRHTMQKAEINYQKLNQNFVKKETQFINYQLAKEANDTKIKSQIKQLNSQFQQKQIQIKLQLEQSQQKNEKLNKKLELLTVSGQSEVLRRKLQTVSKQLAINQVQLKTCRKEIQVKNKQVKQKQRQINILKARLDRERQSYEQKLKRTILNFIENEQTAKTIVYNQKQGKISNFQHQFRGYKSHKDVINIEKIKHQDLIRKLEKEQQIIMDENMCLKNQNQELKQTISSLRCKMEGNLRSMKQMQMNQCISRKITLSRSKSFEFEEDVLTNNKEMSESRQNIQILLRKTQPTFNNFKQLQKRANPNLPNALRGLNQNLTQTVKNKNIVTAFEVTHHNPNIRIKECIQQPDRNDYRPGKTERNFNMNKQKQQREIKNNSNQGAVDRRLSQVMGTMHYSVNLGQVDESNGAESQFPNMITLNQAQLQQNSVSPNQELRLLRKYSKKETKSRYFSEQDGNKKYQENKCQMPTKLNIHNDSANKKGYFQCETDRALQKQIKLQVEDLFGNNQINHKKSVKLKTVKSSNKILDIQDISTQFFSPKYNPQVSQQLIGEYHNFKTNEKKVNMNELDLKIKKIRQSNKQLRKGNLSGNLFEYKSPNNKNKLCVRQERNASRTFEYGSPLEQQALIQTHTQSNQDKNKKYDDGKLTVTGFKNDKKFEKNTNRNGNTAQNFFKNLKKQPFKNDNI